MGRKSSRTCKSASTRRNLQRRGSPKQRNGSRMVRTRCCQLSSKSHQIRRLTKRKWWMCNVELGNFEMGQIRLKFDKTCVTSFLRAEECHACKKNFLTSDSTFE